MHAYLSMYMYLYIYSGTPLVRPSLLHQKNCLSRGLATSQGWKSVHLCLDLHCQVAFP